MKAIVFLLLAPFLALGDELSLPEDFEPDPERPDITFRVSAFHKYEEEKAALKANYRKRMAKAFREADGVEVFLLSFTMQEPVGDPLDDSDAAGESEYFFIAPYQLDSKILSRKRLECKAKAECLTALTELLNESEDFMGGAFCHYPIHGIRLYRAKELIFETSFCWECDNYFFEYPYEGETEWVGFSVNGLEKFLNKHMPIPLNERERFEAKFGTKRKRAEQADAVQPATGADSRAEGGKESTPELESGCP